MSPDIVKETQFLLYSVLLGAFFTFLYDWLRIIRRLFSHKNFMVSLEDFLFWCVCSIFTFQMLYKENNGILRWFAVVGAAIGMILFKLLFSRIFVKGMVFLLGYVLLSVRWIWNLMAFSFCGFPIFTREN